MRLFEGPIGDPRVLEDAIRWSKAGRDCTIEEIHDCIRTFRDDLERRLRRELPEIEVRFNGQ